MSRDHYIYDAGRARFVDRPLLTSYHHHRPLSIIRPCISVQYTHGSSTLRYVVMNMRLTWTLFSLERVRIREITSLANS